MTESLTIRKDDSWRTAGWTAAPNLVIRDHRLSPEARWLWIYLSSHTETFTVTHGTIRAASGGWGRDKIRGTYRELDRYGYLIREQIKDATGRYGNYLFTLTFPRSDPATGNPDPEITSSSPEPATPSTAQPDAGKPETANPPPYKKTIPSKKTKDQEDQASLPLPNTAASFEAKTASRRGTRIPEDFAYTPDMAAWARSNCANVDIGLETDQFVDYWMAKAGQQATKLDWRRTWQTWMRSAEKYAARKPQRRSSVFTDVTTGRSIER